MCVFPCGICLGVMRLGDGLICPHRLIFMIKRGDKRRCDYLFAWDVLKMVECRYYNGKVYYYRMQIVIRECQSICALTDILLIWFSRRDCVLYWTRRSVIIEVIICHRDIWFIEILHYYLYLISYCAHALTWDSVWVNVTRGDQLCWNWVMIIWAHGDRPCNAIVMIMILAHGDRPCKICLNYDSVLRSSAQTRGDRPCRYMDLTSPTWVINSRCISEEYIV